jgi:DNA polymerase
MPTFSLDFETTSACDISYGAYRYAADPSTRILLFAIAQDDEAPVVWRIDKPDSPESCKALYRFHMAVKDSSPIRAFNVGFEAAVCKYVLERQLGIKPPALEQWRCTQAMCRRAAIPASLAKAAEFLKLGDQKNPIGKALIGVFSDQNKRVDLLPPKGDMKEADWKKLKRTSASPILEDEIPWDWTFSIAGGRMTVREGWDAFIAYCRQDVVVERQVCAKLAKYELEGTELDGFQFDLRMNSLGTPVNVPALRNAQKIVDIQCGFLTREFERLTGLQPGQTAAVLKWLKGHGYPGDNLQATTMEEHLGHASMSLEGHRALEIRSQLSFAAVKKVPAMLNTVCPDGRMRGLFTWYGASATGRWTSTGPQLQNAKKPSIKDPDAAYYDICNEPDIDFIEAAYGNPYEVVASCVRNFVQPEEGQIIDVDFSNIESRVAAWLAGQEDLLDTYRQGRDAYKELAAQVFNVSVESVTKEQRFVGKVGNLSLVFQTGAKTFHETCAAWGMPIEKKVACRTVKTFRETYDQFPKTWRRYEAAALKAMEEPGKWHDATEFVSFAMSRSVPFPRLLMRLPSGRFLTYPLPEVKRTMKSHKDYETGERREWESDDLSFYGHLRNSVAWGRVSTYAGSLFQSSVQATARDILQHGCLLVEKAGFKVFSVIHDQTLAHEGDVDQFVKLICTHPEWLPKTFPVAATGELAPYYRKD